MRVRLVDAQDSGPAGQELVCLAQPYVRYAVEHPAVFRLMFNRSCDPSHSGVKAAGDAACAVLSPHVVAGVPPELHETHVTGWWSLVHGLAALVLYGKIPRDDGAIQQVDELVRSTVTAMSRP